MKPIIKVSIPNTPHHAFDYYAKDHLPLPSLGARVWVPFRQQQRMGVVVDIEPPQPHRPNIKDIDVIIDNDPIIPQELLNLCHWVSRYYQAPLSAVLLLALPKKYRINDNDNIPKEHYYQLTKTKEETLALLPTHAPRQHQLVDFFLNHNAPISKKTIVQEGFSTAFLNAFLTKNILIQQSKDALPKPYLGSQQQPLLPNDEQGTAIATISESLHHYRAFLLQGITGSGKTEVYLQIIANVLATGRQVLILVPEIGLTPQLLARFRERFCEPMAIIHSGLNDTERQQAWHWAKNEDVKLVIGTRAAIFTPMPALGLIVIDEEHDASLKQTEGVRYSARDTALMRAHLNNIPIILGSATPSLESMHNATIGKYTLLRLQKKALNQVPLHYQIVDIRNQSLQQGLAATTIATIKKHLESKNQILVFINRRGYAPVVLCHHCGWMADCHACDAHLTWHKNKSQLICHHCGVIQNTPATCPQCRGQELLPIGWGTQRIHEYLSTIFPDTHVLRIDRDEIQKKGALDASLTLIHDGQAEIIVGTQLLAKGHHFPRLTLVVVLDTDNGFYNQDYRATERLGQLLTQVAGRAGRAEMPGHVIIQTHIPQHPLLNLLIQQGYDAFADALLKARSDAHWPPYHYLAILRAEDKIPANVLRFLHAIKEEGQRLPIQVLGPAPAPLARKAHIHRMQLLIKSSSRKQLQEALITLRTWITTQRTYRNMRWNIDVDPLDLS